MNRGTRRPVAVAITGGIGCGKSEVARIFQDEGCVVLDADDVARELVAPGATALREIAERFGPEMVKADGSLDRRRLARRVFGNEDELQKLNRIIHPRVREQMRAWVDEQRAMGRPCAGVIPLLYEVGAGHEWDVVVCVSSPDDMSRERLRERGWSDEEIGLRRAAQWNLAEKKKRADVIIENDGSMEQLAARVRAALNEILKKESQHG